MINIKKILCEVIDEDDDGYIKVWEFGLHFAFLAMVLCCILLMSSLIGYNVIEAYNNGFDGIRSMNGMPLLQVITISNVTVGSAAIFITVIILYILYKILNMNIISCNLKDGK